MSLYDFQNLNIMNYKIQQSSKREFKSSNFWNWSVWVEGSPEDLDIDHIEYILHSTFPNRVRTISSRRTKFKLKSKGWGEFTFKIRIYLNDNSRPLYLKHDLKLFDQTAKESKSVFISAPLKNKDEALELARELKEVNLVVRSQDNIEPEGSLIDSLSLHNS